MTPAERQAQGVETAGVARRTLSDVVIAPGEVQMNAYRSAQITPRVGAQIVARHARLGESVKQGQPLVTLSSVEVAQAQGDVVETDREWRRVKELGRKVVSEKRYVSAQLARQRAYATVRAYGMTKTQIGALLQSADASRATGEFDLFAPQDGRVISDRFVVGEFVSPGRVLFELTDVSAPWVEAQLNPRDAEKVAVGTPVRVSRDGKQWLDGRVVQLYSRLDPATRTHPVRIEMNNSDVLLPAGEYVDVAVPTSEATPSLAVPRDALVLMQGAQTVFKLEGEELHPQPVETGVTRAGWTEIKAGLAEDDEIVVKGAFLLKSLTLKSQMGEGHGH
jgi:cobalt-zinc-cadmium efflux system membrane fusion protein